VSSVGGKASSGGGASGASSLPIAKAPGDAWFAVGVRDLGTKLNTAITELGKIGAAGNGQNFNQILAQLKQSTGLDLQKDLFSWMGDAGLFVKGTSTADLGGAIIIHSTNPAASQAAVGKIADLLSKIGRTSTKISVPGGGIGIQVATTATGPPVDIAATGSFFVIALGSGGLADALNPASTLDTTPNFQSAVASLKGATPALYLNLQTVFGFLESLAPDNASVQKIEPYLAAFQSVIAGSSSGVAKIVINVK
jgi:hypothetical protein